MSTTLLLETKMAKKAKEAKVEPSTFRVMIERKGFINSHEDFATKEEALTYAHDTLCNDKKVAWYGVYELSPKVDYLISIEHKRLISHDDKIIVKPKETDENQKRKRVSKRVK